MLDIKNFNKLVKSKQTLLKCIFSTLIAQMLVTTIVVYILYKFNKIHIALNLLTFLIVLGINIYLIFLMIGKNISFDTRVLYFTIFSVLNGLIVGSFTKFFSPTDIKIALISVFGDICIIFYFWCIKCNVKDRFILVRDTSIYMFGCINNKIFDNVYISGKKEDVYDDKYLWNSII